MIRLHTGVESRLIVKTLGTAGKNAVLIDEHGLRPRIGNERQSPPARLHAVSAGKDLYRVNWNSLFSYVRTEAALDGAVGQIISFAGTRSNKAVIWLDDIAAFSTTTPMLGARVSSQINAAIAAGKIQVFSASDALSFDDQIARSDTMRPRFEKIEILKDDEQDSFVGDKLSPDLRELVAGADQNRTVKVILQSDDIDNPQLLNVLKRNNVAIDARAEALNMLMIDLPVRVAEQVAAAGSAKHLSLDRDVELLGHIETTTGVSQVRTMTNTAYWVQSAAVIKYRYQPIGWIGSGRRGRRFGCV